MAVEGEVMAAEGEEEIEEEVAFLRQQALEKIEERVLEIAREAEDEAERIRLANEGRVQGACQIEGEKKSKDLITNKIYCSRSAMLYDCCCSR